MKNIIILIAVCIFSLNAGAQTTTHNKSKTKMHTGKFCAKLKDGKIEIMHGTMALASDTTLANGVMIKTDGTVVKKDGTQTMLKNGDCVDHNGDWMPKMEKKKKTG